MRRVSSVMKFRAKETQTFAYKWSAQIISRSIHQTVCSICSIGFLALKLVPANTRTTGMMGFDSIADL
jgi:hypothetical protein